MTPVSPACRGAYSLLILLALQCIAWDTWAAGTYVPYLALVWSCRDRDYKGYALLIGLVALVAIDWWLAGGLFTLLVERCRLVFVITWEYRVPTCQSIALFFWMIVL